MHPITFIEENRYVLESISHFLLQEGEKQVDPYDAVSSIYSHSLSDKEFQKELICGIYPPPPSITYEFSEAFSSEAFTLEAWFI